MNTSNQYICSLRTRISFVALFSSTYWHYGIFIINRYEWLVGGCSHILLIKLWWWSQLTSYNNLGGMLETLFPKIYSTRILHILSLLGQVFLNYTLIKRVNNKLLSYFIIYLYFILSDDVISGNANNIATLAQPWVWFIKLCFQSSRSILNWSSE